MLIRPDQRAFGLIQVPQRRVWQANDIHRYACSARLTDGDIQVLRIDIIERQQRTTSAEEFV